MITFLSLLSFISYKCHCSVGDKIEGLYDACSKLNHLMVHNDKSRYWRCLETFIAIWHFYCFFKTLVHDRLKFSDSLIAHGLLSGYFITSSDCQSVPLRSLSRHDVACGMKMQVFIECSVYIHILGVWGEWPLLSVVPSWEWESERHFHFLLYTLVYFGAYI